MGKYRANKVISKLKRSIKNRRKKLSNKQHRELRDENATQLVSNALKSSEGDAKLNRRKARIILFLTALLLLASGSLHIYMGVKSKENIKTNVYQLRNNISRISASMDSPSTFSNNETEFQAPSAPESMLPNLNFEAAPEPPSSDAIHERLGAWVFGNPYNSLIWMGAIILLIGLVALYGSFSLSPQFLFGYYLLGFVIIPLLIYLSCFCFLFASDQREYVEILHKYVKASKEMDNVGKIFSKARIHMIWSGILSLFTSIVIAVGIWFSSTLMGHDYAAKRLSMSMNLVTVIFGTFLLYLAIVASEAEIGGWIAILIAVAGAFTILISLLGYYGLAKESKILLIFHSFSLCLIGSIMLVGCISSFALKDRARYVVSHWILLKEKFTIDDIFTSLSNHILLIGVASALVLFCMVVNLTTSIYALKSIYKRQIRMGDSELALSDYKKMKAKNQKFNENFGSESDEDDGYSDENGMEDEEDQDSSEEIRRYMEKSKSLKEERRRKLMQQMLSMEMDENKENRRTERKTEEEEENPVQRKIIHSTTNENTNSKNSSSEKNQSEGNPSEMMLPSQFIRRISDKILTAVNEQLALSSEEKRQRKRRNENRNRNQRNSRWFEDVPSLNGHEKSLENENRENWEREKARDRRIKGERKDVETESDDKSLQELDSPAWERRRTQSEKDFVARMKNTKKKNFFDK